MVAEFGGQVTCGLAEKKLGSILRVPQHKKDRGMSGRIRGISRTTLWGAWKAVRRQLRSSAIRDVVDFLDYDLEPDVWINDLLARIDQGTYEPRAPRRFMLAKSKGLSRRMTFPEIPDLVLYRAIVDFLYARSKRRECKHVYFERKRLERARRDAGEEAALEKKLRSPLWRTVGEGIADYESRSTRRFRAWLAYNQYRKYLIFRKIHTFIVKTDITNFFDSVLFCRVADSLHEIAAPQGMVSLLFMLLERLGLRGGLKESPRIGLPVDEFDCSRKLAHMVLYPHDGHMARLVGEERYIRWMDDQVFGADSREEALGILAAVCESLGNLQLTPNAGKSYILSISEAKRHYHLRANALLDEAEELVKDGKSRSAIGAKLRKCWSRAKHDDGVGEWDKVLKRLYRLAGIAGLRMFRRRALADTLQYPALAKRVSDYMRCTGTVKEYLSYADSVLRHPEQLYSDVSRTLVESLLRLEPDEAESREIRRLGSSLLSGKLKVAGRRNCCGLAPLIILRYGDRRSLPLLERCIEMRVKGLGPEAARCAGFVYAGYGATQFAVVRRAASRLLRNYLGHMVRMLEKIKSYDEIPPRFVPRLNLRFDPVANQPYVDMRSVVAARLLRVNKRKAVRTWIASRRQGFLKQPISRYDRRLLHRLWPVDG